MRRLNKSTCTPYINIDYLDSFPDFLFLWLLSTFVVLKSYHERPQREPPRLQSWPVVEAAKVQGKKRFIPF